MRGGKMGRREEGVSPFVLPVIPFVREFVPVPRQILIMREDWKRVSVCRQSTKSTTFYENKIKNCIYQ